MKEFLQLMRRFVAPYKRYIGWAVVLNVLSAVFNVFSFTLLIPILNILFKTGDGDKVYHFMEWGSAGLMDVAVNNFYYGVTCLIASYGPVTTLLFLGLFLGFMTLLKTSCYFGSSAVMIPLRTGVVRDIRVMVYNKVLSLPLGFFSEERKGDIIARMSGDVTEIETSVTSSLDMLLKNPILILFYFSTLIITSWQLTLFTLLVLPGMGWVMGTVGKKLKRKSLDAQNKWSDTMAQLDETLGGLRIIKAFIAEEKMSRRFTECSDEFRKATNRVAMRQALAHPMSEFLGTLLIVAVLWFGGYIILGTHSSAINASTFIFYMVILYSMINPLKDFSKAGYNIPKGLASMERIDKILKAENLIKEPLQPKPLKELKQKIEFRDISFSYDGRREVLKHVNLTVEQGEYLAIMGPSGSGKTTLMNIIGCLDVPTSGSYILEGRDLKDLSDDDLAEVRNKHIGFVFQSFHLLPKMEAVDNVALPLLYADVPLKERRARAEEALKAVGLGERIHFLPNQLSGGQCQRVAIARAIVGNPQLLLADEPTGALDTKAGHQIMEIFRRLSGEGMTIIMITHEPSIAACADKTYRILDGELKTQEEQDEKA